MTEQQEAKCKDAVRCSVYRKRSKLEETVHHEIRELSSRLGELRKTSISRAVGDAAGPMRANALAALETEGAGEVCDQVVGECGEPVLDEKTK
jgi:hypothetical protein